MKIHLKSFNFQAQVQRENLVDIKALNMLKYTHKFFYCKLIIFSIINRDFHFYVIEE